MSILALAAVIAICWTYLLVGAGTGMYPPEMAALIPSMPANDPLILSGSELPAPSPSMPSPHWTPAYGLLMFSMWWLMMIAMMLPSAAPMVLSHAAITRRAVAGSAAAGSERLAPRIYPAATAFVAGYLFMWGVFSVFAVCAQWLLQDSGLLDSMMTTTSRLVGSGLLLAAGLWQLTPVKTACLRKCRSPVSFFATHWRPGTVGAFRMGARHGAFCLGCCWLLMGLLFLGGVMNLVWILALAVYVLLEKLIPGGIAVGRVIGLLMILWGGWLGVTAF